jgi:sphingosine kinase
MCSGRICWQCPILACYREVTRNLDLSLFHGIVSISGDGLLHEIYNGLRDRADADVACETPMGLVPGGSGCALNCSLLVRLGQTLDGLNSLGPAASSRNVAVGAATGSTEKLDLIEIEMASSKTKIWSFLGVSLGIIADCDLGSEWLREGVVRESPKCYM